MDPRADVERIRQEYPHCFACGLENPLGLRIDGFSVEGDWVIASFRPRAEYAGFDGLLHGGIVATALDEILAWTVILKRRTLAVTGTLDIRYRRTLPPQGTYRLRGRIEQDRGSRLRLLGQLLHNDEVAAEARGLYLLHRELDEELMADR
ncbi:MAG: PaaI family thioesterase [Acidimicrobiia bacterium]